MEAEFVYAIWPPINRNYTNYIETGRFIQVDGAQAYASTLAYSQNSNPVPAILCEGQRNKNTMLKRNQVPSEVLEQLTAHDPDFCVYSFDVTDDGQYALILGIGQDPDFPELHVYRAASNRVTEVDTGGQLVDMPLSKAFWDRNQTSVCVMHLYSKDIYQLVLNSDHKVSEMHNVTGYLAQRAEAVEDKVNYVPDEAPQTSDEYEAFFVQFLAELRAGLSWCERFMDDEVKLKQEYRAIQSRAAMLREWRAQHNSEVDVSDIYDRCNAIRTKLGYDAEHHF